MKKHFLGFALPVLFLVLPCLSYGAPDPVPPVSPFVQMGMDSVALSEIIPNDSIAVKVGVLEPVSMLYVTADENQSYRRTKLAPVIPPRNAGLAGVLSLLVPGLGHAYNTDIGTSNGFFTAAISSVAVIAFSSYVGAPVVSMGKIIGISGYVFCQLASAYDATSLSGRINDGMKGKKTAYGATGSGQARKAPRENEEGSAR